MTSLKRLENAIGYSFQNPDYLTRALTHRSRGRDNNERLEFLGDGLLGFVVADELFKAFPNCSEGDLTRLRAQLVNKHALARLGRELQLGNHLLLGQGELKSGGFDRDSILADGVEALIGAVYIDGGINPATELVQRLMRAPVAALDPVDVGKDPKTSLQEFLAQRAIAHPSYRIIDTDGPPHARVFTVRCSIPGHPEEFEGKGNSVRRAEQVAAAAAQSALSSTE